MEEDLVGERGYVVEVSEALSLDDAFGRGVLPF